MGGRKTGFMCPGLNPVIPACNGDGGVGRWGGGGQMGTWRGALLNREEPYVNRGGGLGMKGG